MVTNKTKIKTVYLIFYEGNILQAASTLPKLVGAQLHGKGYHFYYRRLNGCDETTYLHDGKTYKIKRLQYG